MFRLIKEVKPEFIIGENVQGIINLQDGMVLRQVQDELEGEGFEVQCFLIPASGIGAWHQRKRTWIIANSNSGLSIGKNEEVQARGNTITGSGENDSNSTIRRWQKCEPKSKEKNDIGKVCKNVSNNQRCKEFNISRKPEKSFFNHRRYDEKQQTWWQTQSEFCGVPNGISYELDKGRTNRIKALGNSIVPQIARELGLAIITAEHEA